MEKETVSIGPQGYKSWDSAHYHVKPVNPDHSHGLTSDKSGIHIGFFNNSLTESKDVIVTRKEALPLPTPTKYS